MLQRLNIDDDQDAGEARLAFDDSLAMHEWRTPSGREREAPEREEGAPYWWHGDEDASSGFLKSMGVVLDA